MELTNKEKEVIVRLIDAQQFDGAEWTLEGISLSKLKNKLQGSVNGKIKPRRNKVLVSRS